MSSFMHSSDSDPFLSQWTQHGQTQGIPDLPEGTVLLDGRYTIGGRLGSGGFSAAFRAYDALRGKDVALKIAEAGPCDPQVAGQVLENEAKIYALIGGDPNILTVYDLHFIRYGNTGFLAMSMEVAAESLQTWLLRHKDDHQARVAQGLEYFKILLRALSAVHRAGTVHLDVKPANCLFVHGKLKLGDFGSARIFQTIQLTSGIEVPNLAYRIGTPAYMSPELLTAAHPDDVDGRADLYSLGCVLYEMLHRKCHPPFGGSLEELRERHLHFTPPRLEGVSEKIARVVARCLEKK
jgi:eukaryotic-like serine/threonine-protein kinase